MSDKNKINDLTDDMISEFDTELDDSELLNPSEYNHEDKKPKKTSSRNKDIEDEDEDEEDEDEDEDEVGLDTKPFLSTQSGKIFLGAGVFGISVVFVGGYMAFNSITGNSNKVVNTNIEKPSISPIYEEAKEEINLEESKLLANNKEEFKSLEINFDAVKNFDDKTPSINSELAINFPDKETSNNEGNIPSLVEEPRFDLSLFDNDTESKADDIQPVENSIPEIVVIKEKHDSLVGSESTAITLNSDVIDIVSVGSTINELTEKPLNVIDSASIVIPQENTVNTVDVVDIVNVDSVKSSVAKPDEAITEDQISSIVSKIVNQKLEGKEIELAQLRKQVETLKTQNNYLDNEHQSIVLEKEDPGVTFIEKPDKSNFVDPSHLNRDRLKGFKITNTSMDGKMAIVQAPSGRTVVLYKGEKFYVKGLGSFIVNEILNDGKLILANKNYFIDDNFEEIKKPYSAVETNKEKYDKYKEEQRTNKIIKHQDSLKNKKLSNLARMSESIDGKSKILADKWSWNGQVGSDFLIQDPSGDFEVVKVGQSIDGLGIVVGLTENNKLIIGKFYVEKAVD